MNALEKEIEEKIDQIEDSDLDCDSNAYTEGFSEGANFILKKNLPVLFSDWLDEHCQMVLGENGMQSTQDIYDYWLNNVYGK